MFPGGHSECKFSASEFLYYLELKHNCNITGKVALVLIKYYVTTMYLGVEVSLHSFMTSTLDNDEWLVSLSVRFKPGETAPGTHSNL
jgi:hypothetical protein